MWGFSVSGLNFLALCFKMIAFQNEKSGLITILGYVGLLYAFLGDTFIFGEKFENLELVGVIVIFVMNLALIFTEYVAPVTINQKN
jgi:drug/metabolite transporter (DMT)-like permease